MEFTFRRSLHNAVPGDVHAVRHLLCS